ncbi:hypothetical protein OIB37_36025 [Streptomyces sp. NBC_00820]|uniref:hypothetical protein n=1 Tax=Streptomyces sp. NBC_00820 TaxID=2975842 RepID=UPI002ED5B7AF|nr:hypothetical protein OIB37_00175 [Streptomyces sp. NBC_00820]WTI18083.1 hypothetical protein OIB37_36025 [Streptomyces sp. NBC_00820]
MLNPVGRQLLARLGGVGEAAWPNTAAGRWKVASAGEYGPVAYGCRLCTAARTGHDTVVVRYVAPWQRVCARHQRWMQTCGDGHRHRNLDLRASPEVAAAQRDWPKVARTAAAAGADPGRVFALTHAVVCAWWEQALGWERERIWPARLHAVAGGDAGPRFWWWRVVTRDAVTFPETVTLAAVLLDPGVQERIWDDHGRGGPVRPFRPDGAFFRKLAVLLERPWLAKCEQAAERGLVLEGPLHAGPLLDCMGAFTRIRRGQHSSTPKGTGWIRGGCARSTAPPRPGFNCAPWPNELRPHATPVRTALPGPVAVRSRPVGCSATGTGAPPLRTTAPGDRTGPGAAGGAGPHSPVGGATAGTATARAAAWTTRSYSSSPRRIGRPSMVAQQLRPLRARRRRAAGTAPFPG